MLWIGAVDGIDDRIGNLHAERYLPTRGARAQHVQRHARDDRGQPTAQVFYRAPIRSAQLQPGFLDGVVGLAERAEHPVSHRAQMRSVLLKALHHPLLLVHLSHPSRASGHTTRTPESEEM